MELDLRKGNMKYYGRITIEIYLSMNLVRTIRKEDIQKQSRHVQRKEIKKGLYDRVRKTQITYRG